MAKPSGITTGDGTEAHPWEVHNYDEIKWACEDAEAIPEGQTATSDYVYINLVNDIDCQTYDVDFTWNIVCNHAVYFDLCTHTIKTFYIGASNNYTKSAFYTTYLFACINGKILNVYGHWDSGSPCLIYATGGLLVQNLAFSCDMSKINYYAIQAGAKSTIKNCSFWVQGTRTFSGLLGVASDTTISCCDFYFNNFTLSPSAATFLFTQGMLTNCRFQGTLNWGPLINTSTPYLSSNSIFRNCVWDVTINIDTTVELKKYTMTNSNSSSNTGIYNVSKCSEYLKGIDAATTSAYIACTTWDMDMRENANADTTLQNMGFDVIKG